MNFALSAEPRFVIPGQLDLGRSYIAANEAIASVNVL